MRTELWCVGLSISLVACTPAPSGSDAGAPIDAFALSDTAIVDASPDTTGCADLSGAWSFAGTCSPAGFTPFGSACITQTGCTATIVIQPGPSTGTVVGSTLTFTTMVGTTAFDCTANLSGTTLSTQCRAAGGAVTCGANGVHPSFPGATRFCCDVAAQDCAAGQRCNIVGDDASNTNRLTACVPAGTLAAGTTCTRAMGRLGADMCATGLGCVNFGQAAGTRACQHLCGSTADCTAGASCVQIGDAPRSGACTPTCTLGGTDCPTGATCRYNLTWGATDPRSAPGVYATYCAPAGSGAAGASCATFDDCGANLTCGGTTSLVCTANCDATHACPGGRSCTAFTGGTNPAGGGFCAP